MSGASLVESKYEAESDMEGVVGVVVGVVVVAVVVLEGGGVVVRRIVKSIVGWWGSESGCGY